MRRRPLIAVVVAALVAVGCGTGAAPTRAPFLTTPPPVTPLAVPNATIVAARAVLDERLDNAGFTLEQPARRYRPPQPARLQAALHSVFRVDLADPDQGWVVVYDLGNADSAAAAGGEFVRYLETFGRTNYPADARFAINQLGAALIFHWWSRQGSSDPERAEAAFEVISAIGERFDVVG
ncbi:MAG: hypothetical protein M3N29_04075 [Chloroflexota bacterium]|nr:hypothetical protein [Chloroflexota bacterium]